MLVSFLQIGDCRLEVPAIEGNISSQVGKEAGLVGIVSFVECGFGGGHMLLRVVSLTFAGGDAGLSVLPAEEPEIFVGIGEVRLALGSFVS